MLEGIGLKEGLRATLGGSILHDEELGILADPLPGGGLRMTLPYRAALTQPGEGARISAGPLVTVLDTACGVAAIMELGFAEAVATVDLRVDYLRSAEPETDIVVDARANAVLGRPERGSLVIVAQARHPDHPEPVAQAVGRFIRRPVPGSAPPHPVARPAARQSHESYQHLMGFTVNADGDLVLPFRSGLIGNGSLPSIHGGAIAAHLQDAACRAAAGGTANPPALTTAHFAFHSFGREADLVASAQVERHGASVLFVSAHSAQPPARHRTASGAFTFLRFAAAPGSP